MTLLTTIGMMVNHKCKEGDHFILLQCSIMKSLVLDSLLLAKIRQQLKYHGCYQSFDIIPGVNYCRKLPSGHVSTSAHFLQ